MLSFLEREREKEKGREARELLRRANSFKKKKTTNLEKQDISVDCFFY